MKILITTIAALALSFGAWAQTNTMFIHNGQVVHEFQTKDVDSIVFYRTTDQTLPPISIVNRVETGVRVDTVFNTDTIFQKADTIRLMDTIRITDTVCLNDTVSSFLLGKVSFKTDSVWTITNGTITQEWSDVVMATGCKKNDFKGYENGNYLADCRQNPGYGDLFSWEAVNQYKAQLCPNGWRVPTKEDFFTLDTLLGGTGNYQGSNTTHRNKYLTGWGGACGGYCNSYGTPDVRGSYAYYWSQSEFNADGTYGLYFDTNGNVDPQYWDDKSYGFTLRCVR